MRDGERLFLIVGYVHDRQAQLGKERGELVEQTRTQRTVEGAQGLVEHQQPRRGRQCPGQGDALLLAAGQLRDPPRAVAAQAHQREDLVRAHVDRRARVTAHLQAKGHVAAHVALRKEHVVLEHQPDVALVHGHAGKVAAVERDSATGERLEAGNSAQQRRLARAARAQERDRFDLTHGQGDAVDHDRVVVGDADISELEHQASESYWSACSRSKASTLAPVTAMSSTAIAIAWPKASTPGWLSRR